MNSSTTMNDLASAEIVIQRILDAPCELVFDAWTNAQHLAQWWGPRGFTTTTHSFEFKPGGVWHFIMHGPDGRDYPNRVVFNEIVRPDKIIYVHGGEVDIGPISFHTIVAFEKETGADGTPKTKLTLRSVFPSVELRDHVIREYGALQGGIDHVTRLAMYVAAESGIPFKPALTVAMPSVVEAVISREVDAPRQLVWDAWTKPEMLKRWMYGPDEWPLVQCDNNVAVGGKLRWAWRHRDKGTDMVMRGEYREVTPPERLVHTEIFDDDWTDGETLVTTEFTEHDGHTTISLTVLYSSQKARDAALQTGMIIGMSKSYNRLDSLLSSIA